MLDIILAIFGSYFALIPVTLAQSLTLSFVVLGIMLPFRILSFPDLTSEGAYPFGGCVCAVLIGNGMDPVVAIIIAMACGFLAGCSTAFIHLRFGINTLLAGILVLTMLYSINLRIMGRSNMSILGSESIYSIINPSNPNSYTLKMGLAGIAVIVMLLMLKLFFSTEHGITFRAVGANAEMSESQGINVWRITIIGVGAASAFSALAGALMIQSQGFADVNMGFGILINGLASLIIGEAITGRNTVWKQILAPFIGALTYYQLVSFCLAAGLPPPDLKFATGFFVLLMLALPSLKRKGTLPERVKIRE
jgi:putative ABC transport system permease protein